MSKKAIEQAAVASPIAAAAKQIRTLVDDWPRMDAAAEREVRDAMFADVRLEDGALVAAAPRPGWLAYLETALSPVYHVRGWWESNPRRPP